MWIWPRINDKLAEAKKSGGVFVALRRLGDILPYLAILVVCHISIAVHGKDFTQICGERLEYNHEEILHPCKRFAEL